MRIIEYNKYDTSLNYCHNIIKPAETERTYFW